MQYITATTATTTTTTLHYTKLCYTNYITLHYNCNYHYIALHDTTLQLQLHYFTLQYTRLHYTIYTMLQYTTLQYTTIHYTNYTTPQLQLQLRYTNYTTLQLQLKTTTPLHYNYNYTYNYTYNYNCTTPHYIQQLWWGDHCNNIAATPENTTPTTFSSISGFALPSVIHNNQPLLWAYCFWNFRRRLVWHHWYKTLRNNFVYNYLNNYIYI